MSIHEVHAVVNGSEVECRVEARTPLADMLRNHLGLVGTKVSCGVQVCGSCTVLVDSLPVSSCTYLAVEVDGRSVTTIEGISTPGAPLSHVQKALVDSGAVQCGYCTPGFVLAATALLERNHAPTEPEIKHFLDGNICRCSGYEQILEAVTEAARAVGAEQ